MFGSVSAQQMIQEFNEASVFAFPCSTVALTEGFSLSTLQSHASYTVPVMTSQDCLGSIYRNSGCIMLEAPVENKLKEFTSEVVKALTDKEHADNVIAKTREFSKQYSWDKITNKLEKIIKQ
jgi:glycosyltransferase involved in cell wall biosynthesis